MIGKQHTFETMNWASVIFCSHTLQVKSSPATGPAVFIKSGVLRALFNVFKFMFISVSKKVDAYPGRDEEERKERRQESETEKARRKPKGKRQGWARTPTAMA
jgi:hypothetical protein